MRRKKIIYKEPSKDRIVTLIDNTLEGINKQIDTLKSERSRLAQLRRLYECDYKPN